MLGLFFLLVMFFLGAIAGMLNVWRIFTGRGLTIGYFDESQYQPIEREVCFHVPYKDFD